MPHSVDATVNARGPMAKEMTTNVNFIQYCVCVCVCDKGIGNSRSGNDSDDDAQKKRRNEHIERRRNIV